MRFRVVRKRWRLHAAISGSRADFVVTRHRQCCGGAGLARIGAASVDYLVPNRRVRLRGDAPGNSRRGC